MAVRFQGGRAVPASTPAKKMDRALLRDLESTLFKLRDTSNKLAKLDPPAHDIAGWAERLRVVVAEVMNTDDAQRLRDAVNGGSMSMRGVIEYAERWSQMAENKETRLGNLARSNALPNAKEINNLWSDVRQLVRLVFAKQQRILINAKS